MRSGPYTIIRIKRLEELKNHEVYPKKPVTGSLKKIDGPFLWVGFNCLKATEPLWRNNLLFTILNLRTRKDWPWSHPVVLNPGPLDWKSSTLTTRPLLHKVIAFLLPWRSHELKLFPSSNTSEIVGSFKCDMTRIWYAHSTSRQTDMYVVKGVWLSKHNRIVF